MKRFFVFIFILIIIALGVYYFLFLRNNTGSTEQNNDSGIITNEQDPFGTDTQNQNEQNGPRTDGTGGEALTGGQQGTEGYVGDTPLTWQIVQFSANPILTFQHTEKTETQVIDDEPIKKTIRSIQYIDRTNGHINEYNVKTRQNTKISNATRTGVQIADFISGTLGHITQQLNSFDSILTRYYDADQNSVPLDDNIYQIIAAPTTPYIYIGLKNANEYQGIIARPDGSNAKIIFRSPLREWWATWSGDKEVVIYSTPSYNSQGTAYAVNTATGAATKIISRVPGLEIIKNGTNTYISSQTQPNSLSTTLHTANKSVSLPATLADKCTFNTKSTLIYCAIPKSIPRGTYPDDWNAGAVHFSDNIVALDANTGATLATYTIDNENIDARDLHLSTSEKVLGFINHRDNTGWAILFP